MLSLNRKPGTSFASWWIIGCHVPQGSSLGREGQQCGNKCKTSNRRFLSSDLKSDFFPKQRNIIHSEVTQSCLTLCDPIDCSLPGFSIHGILQARILEWVTISFSRGSSRPRDRTWVFCIGGRLFNLWATREAQYIHPFISLASTYWKPTLCQVVF